MTISPARLAANQANAAKSTGPTTTAGKARSRANAVKHGLCSTVVPITDAATLQARTAGVIDTVRPQNDFQFWLCTQIAETTLKLDQCKLISRQTRDDAMHRAEFCWEEDQQVEADRIGAGLARQPSRTVGQLRRSVAGCDWLIGRWGRLLDAAEHEPWTEEQRTLAHDLLGTPPEFRVSPPTRRLDSQGQAVVPEPSEPDLARAQLAHLRDHRAQVGDADEVAQLWAMADLNDLGSRELGRLRRYERALLNDLKHALEQSRYESPHPAPNSRFLRSIPAHFLDAPGATPPEPQAAAPVEPTPTPSDLPNEPKPLASNEPKPPVSNEPKPPASNEPKPLASNEPKPPGTPWAPSGLAGLDPALAALLEAGMPQPGDLDPAWCREVAAARLADQPPQHPRGSGAA